jgi:hypothetical protein
MCKDKRNPQNLAGMQQRKSETHNGGVLRNGGGRGAHFEQQISATILPCCLKLIKQTVKITRLYFLKSE